MATAIGLDVGSSAVRAVQVTAGGRGPATLDRVGQVVLPNGAVQDGEIADPDTVTEAIRTLWSRHGLKGRKVALGVANQHVVVRQVDLPYLPEDELRDALPFTVQDQIPIPVEQAILDFHILEHFETGEGERFSRVLLVAAQREMIERLVETVRSAKVDPVSIDLDAFALLRSLAPERAVEEREGELLVDAGAAVTNIVVHESGTPRFVRILLMGGNAISEDLTGRLHVSWEEAEDLKSRERRPGPATEAERLVAERADRFVDEVRGSLDYYRAQSDALPVRGAQLTGGASQLPGLAERLSDALHMPVERGHPMRQLKIGKVGLEPEQLVEAEPYLSVAIGLAMGVLE